MGGVALLAVGTGRPWLNVPLQHQVSAMRLAVVAPGFATPTWLSYGSIVLAALALAVAALVRKRGRASALSAIAGAVGMLTPLLFGVASALSDNSLTALLTRRAGEYGQMTSQYGFAVPQAPMTSFILIPLHGAWWTVRPALQPGWLLTLLGGGVLLATGWRPLVAVGRRHRLAAGGVAMLVVAVVAIAFGRGYWGNRVADSALSAGHAGSYRLALSRFQRAEDLNPTVRLRVDVEEAASVALAQTGQTTLPLARFAEVRTKLSSRETDLALAQLHTIHAMDPGNTVIADAYREAAVASARRSGSAAALGPLLAQPVLDALSARYTLGRVLYRNQAYTDAMAQMQWVVDHTVDDELASSALTYVSLCQKGLGDDIAARKTLLAAIARDRAYANLPARALAAGLFTPGRF